VTGVSVASGLPTFQWALEANEWVGEIDVDIAFNGALVPIATGGWIGPRSQNTSSAGTTWFAKDSTHWPLLPGTYWVTVQTWTGCDTSSFMWDQPATVRMCVNGPPGYEQVVDPVWTKPYRFTVQPSQVPKPSPSRQQYDLKFWGTETRAEHLIEDLGIFYRGRNVDIDQAVCLGVRRFGVKTVSYDGIREPGYVVLNCLLNGADRHVYRGYYYWRSAVWKQLRRIL
jgi:hypothetical protein